MKNSIIGTAGHVDHGKTMLIKALTGIDADRLREEKKRGITIELGFAWLDLPDGGRAGIVDVPGHEKFVKNMLAGVGSIDVVLLVVAADEGFMPQTREHLDILSILGMKRGIIVLTKTDMVDEEWLEVVKDEVRSEVQGSFLQDAPMMCVSSYTGDGIEELRQTIFEQLSKADAKDESAPVRIPVDRVFSVDGFGTVITGTLSEGTLSEGDEVMLYPSEIAAKVRGVQVHSRAVPRAYAGQRVAVNLAGVKKEKVQRGDWVAQPGTLSGSLMLDVRIRALAHSDRELANGSRLHFHHGAGCCLAKLVLLDRDVLLPGQEAFAQLRFTQPVTVKPADRFVVRFYSPIETVGGGIVLDAHPPRHKRHDETVLAGLAVKAEGSAESRVLQKFKEMGMQLPSVQEVYDSVGGSKSEFDEIVHNACAAGALIELSAKYRMHRDVFAALSEKAQALLVEYHEKNPLQAGMRREELRSRLLPGRSPALCDSVIALLISHKAAEEKNGRICKSGFTVQYTTAQKALADTIETQFLQSGFEPPALDELEKQYAKQKDAKAVLTALLDEGKLVPLTPQLAMHSTVCEKGLSLLREHCAQNANITLAQFRDAIGTSRKYALALLEYFDRQGITRKEGDARVLRKTQA